MGLFSKKDYVCERCGKTYQKRINLNGNLCDECYNEKISLQVAVGGYNDYACGALCKSYTIEELKEIVSHKDSIVRKYKRKSGNVREDLATACVNYKQLSDSQALNILVKAVDSSVTSTLGAAYSGKFFLPTQYEGVIVDSADVFAVGYTTDFKLQTPESASSEVILCGVFTNDPYIPAFPMVYVAKTGFFDIIKSKRGRAGVNSLFESMCPYLTYPVGDIKDLKKQIKQEGTLNSKMDMELAINLMDDLYGGSGIFNTKKMVDSLPYGSKSLLDDMGYITEEDIQSILRLDNSACGRFWKKQMSYL